MIRGEEFEDRPSCADVDESPNARTSAIPRKIHCVLVFMVLNAETRSTGESIAFFSAILCVLSASALKNTI